MRLIQPVNRQPPDDLNTSNQNGFRLVDLSGYDIEALIQAVYEIDMGHAAGAEERPIPFGPFIALGMAGFISPTVVGFASFIRPIMVPPISSRTK